MRKTMIFLTTLLLATASWAGTINVSAAISLKESLQEIAKQYESDTSEKVDLNFGASGTLAAQIKQGAPVDLFISAANKQVDDLVAAGLADADSRKAIAGNSLVLIVPKDQKNPPTKFEDLTDGRFKHIAIGEPKVVPAGQYAMQTLQKMGLDKALADRLVMGENVRQVLVYVQHGDADAGIVYSTDAAAAGQDVHVVATAPESTHDPITYPAVTLKAGQHDAAKKFLDYVEGPKGQAILAAHGFTAPKN